MDKRQLLKTALATGVMAARWPPRPRRQADPARHDSLVQRTFALAAVGQRGVEIWIDDVNSRGGIDIGGRKRKVELVKLDDRSDKTVIPKVYETLIKEEKCDLLFGPFGSTLTSAAANTTELAEKMMIIWSASDSIYQQGFKSIVSATQIAGTLLGQNGVRAIHAMGARKIAFAYLDEPFPAALTQGAVALAKELGMEVTANEKFAKGTKDFNILIQKAKASGADAFYPTAYEGDQMTIARQLREANVLFKAVYFVYASQPQFLQQAGKDSLPSARRCCTEDNWKVTHGLNRAQMVERYAKLFPQAQYPADFQTALAYGAGVVTEQMIRGAQSSGSQAQGCRDGSTARS
jgi:branched-chain amino acid transport system substrate-binding protein